VSEAISLDWSSRHTRLRYQTVLAALAFAASARYGVKEIKLPFFVTFERTPEDSLVLIGFFLFFLFSLGSFVSQHLVENRVSPDYSLEIQNVLRSLKTKVLQDNAAMESYLLKITRMHEQLSHLSQQVAEEEDQLWLEETESLSFDKLEDWVDFIKSRYDEEALGYSSEIERYFPSKFSSYASIKRSMNNALDAFLVFAERSAGSSRSERSFNVFFRKASVERMPGDIENIGDGIRSLSAAFSKMDNELIALKAHRNVHSILLAFLFPIAASVLLVFFGIYEVLK